MENVTQPDIGYVGYKTKRTAHTQPNIEVGEWEPGNASDSFHWFNTETSTSGPETTEPVDTEDTVTLPVAKVDELVNTIKMLKNEFVIVRKDLDRTAAFVQNSAYDYRYTQMRLDSILAACGNKSKTGMFRRIVRALGSKVKARPVRTSSPFVL